MKPETHDTQSGDVNIAYQVVGHGPRDHALKGVSGDWHLFAVDPN